MKQFSRRDFLASAALAGPALLKAATGTVSIDMHNHVYPAGTEPGRGGQQQPQGTGLQMAEEIRRSGLTAVCASFVLDQTPIQKPGDARDTFLRWLTAMDAELVKGKMRRALNLKDLQASHDSGQPVIVQTVEGSQFIEGHLDRVEEVYRRGVRHLQLLHEKDDLVSPLGDTNTGTAHLGGLTAMGASVLKECNRLGMLVDMAHASHETVLGALKVARQPFIISHTCLDSRTGGNARMAEMMKPRLISREHAKVVADAGGVVGVWTKLADTLPDFVESIKAMGDAVGIDHVGIVSDTDLLSSRAGQGTNNAYAGMTGGFFNAVAGEMTRQGFTAEDIGKVGGGNYCRVFGKATS
jgi:membrane dipeptidase